jgi:hypothetical protein
MAGKKNYSKKLAVLRKSRMLAIAAILAAAILAVLHIAGDFREDLGRADGPDRDTYPKPKIGEGVGGNTLNNSVQDRLEGYEISSGWTITSYQDIDERLYSGKKVEVFDEHGNLLGIYRVDFLRQVKIDGSGVGDGVGNTGQHLHYNYRIDDGRTHYLSDISYGAFMNELVPWTGEFPSVAVNPPLPKGSKIVFVDLGNDARHLEGWVYDLLMSKIFYSDDTFHGWTEKKIDVYVGFQKTLEYGPEALLLRNVTLGIKLPE